MEYDWYKQNGAHRKDAACYLWNNALYALYKSGHYRAVAAILFEAVLKGMV